jgi:hypothetical protein
LEIHVTCVAKFVSPCRTVPFFVPGRLGNESLLTDLRVATRARNMGVLDGEL